MRQQRADAVAERDKWREAFENQQRLALPAPGQMPQHATGDAPPASRLRGTWRWLRSTGEELGGSGAQKKTGRGSMPTRSRTISAGVGSPPRAVN